MLVTREPAILYFGTPVVLVSTTNEDGSANLAPLSSAFWLGWRCILGIAAQSKTSENLRRSRQCVVNLPSVDQVAAVDRLARTTGSDPVPAGKQARGYRHAAAKFSLAGLTPIASETVAPPRAEECPVQMEAVLEAVHDVGEHDELLRGRIQTFELRIQRVHLDEQILMADRPNQVDPDKWRPLIMSFQKFYGLAPGQLQPSTLAEIAEALYRTPDVDRARTAERVAMPA